MMASKTRPKQRTQPDAPARIEYLRVENYRALKSVELDNLTPLTVLLGPNGSGKSTIFDVFNFLSECFTLGLRKAWDKRGRFREMRTRGSSGTVVFELRYRETPELPPASYHLEIDERDGAPMVAEESLQWRRVASNVPGAPYKILSFKDGAGWGSRGPAGPERHQGPRAIGCTRHAGRQHAGPTRQTPPRRRPTTFHQRLARVLPVRR